MTDFIYSTPLPPSSRKEMPGCIRRQYARIYKKSPITFSLLKTSDNHSATMYNEGSGGMYFEADAPLTPGTIIQIKLLESAASAIEPSFPDTVYTAEVRWCREINKRLPEKRFGIGVHYRKTLVQ